MQRCQCLCYAPLGSLRCKCLLRFFLCSVPLAPSLTRLPPPQFCADAMPRGAGLCLVFGLWDGGGEDMWAKSFCVPKMGLSCLALYSKFHFCAEEIFFSCVGGWFEQTRGKCNSSNEQTPCVCEKGMPLSFGDVFCFLCLWS